MQSHQDDTYNDLATFAETSYIFLTLLSLQRRLNYDELYLLERATKAAARSQASAGSIWQMDSTRRQPYRKRSPSLPVIRLQRRTCGLRKIMRNIAAAIRFRLPRNTRPGLPSWRTSYSGQRSDFCQKNLLRLRVSLSNNQSAGENARHNRSQRRTTLHGSNRCPYAASGMASAMTCGNSPALAFPAYGAAFSL
jgi:hypothetical protein